MSLDTNLISWALTVVAALTAVYFNFKSSKREDSAERRGYDSGVVADLKMLLQEYRTRLDGMVIERDQAALKIISLEAEIVLLERRIKDIRLEVLELNQDIIQAARAKNAKSS